MARRVSEKLSTEVEEGVEKSSIELEEEAEKLRQLGEGVEAEIRRLEHGMGTADAALKHRLEEDVNRLKLEGIKMEDLRIKKMSEAYLMSDMERNKESYNRFYGH